MKITLALALLASITDSSALSIHQHQSKLGTKVKLTHELTRTE